VVQARDIQGLLFSEDLLKKIEGLLGEDSVFIEY
jgi:hypothetical protein